MRICGRKACTSCGACANACPKHAIHMQKQDNGFYYPQIDEAACIRCGRCGEVCPVQHPVPRMQGVPRAYAVSPLDAEEAKNSSSGGIFWGLAQSILQRDGVVIGSAWGDDWSVGLQLAKTVGEAARFRGSKYVESLTGEVYSQVKEALRSEREVLFTGLPCQCAGLLAFLGEHPENLYVADIVCHGVCSTGLFQDYVRDLARSGAEVSSVTFRYKNAPWTPLLRINVRVEWADGRHEVRDYKEDPYLKAFNAGYAYRDSCYSCPYASLPRVSDLTIGDFMGLGHFGGPTKLKNSAAGVSQLLINSEKGAALVASLHDRFELERRDLLDCLVFNHNLWKPSPRKPQTSSFYADYEQGGWKTVTEKYLRGTLTSEAMLRLREAVRRLVGDDMAVEMVATSYKRSGLVQRAEDYLEELTTSYEEVPGDVADS